MTHIYLSTTNIYSYLKFTLTLCFSILLTQSKSFAQCTHTDNDGSTNRIGTHTSGSLGTLTTSINQRNPANQNSWYTLGVEEGVEYYFHTCDNPFDSRLEARQGSTSGSLVINVDDAPQEGCTTGARESIYWTSGFTGTLYVGVHHWSGTWQGGTSAILKYQQSSTVTNTTSTASICEGGTKTLSASFNSIQCHENSVSYSIISGSGSVTGNTYSAGSYTGSVTIRATHGVSTSDVSFSVVADPTVTISGGNTSVCYGGSAGALTASISGNGSCSGYQWQKSTDGINWQNISGATSSSYTPSNLTESIFIRCLSSSCPVSGCSGSPSNVRFIGVTPIAGVGTHPSPETQTVCEGSNVSYSAQANLGNGTTRYKLVLTSAHGANWHGIQEIRGFNSSGTEQSLSCVNASSSTYTSSMCGSGAYAASNAFDGVYNSGTSNGLQWLTPQNTSAPNANWQNYNTFNPFYAPEWIEFSSPQPLSELWVYNGRYYPGTSVTCFKDFYILASFDNGATWSKLHEGSMSSTQGIDGNNNKFNLEPTYTWKKGASTVGSGKTLTLNSVDAADAGTYTVEVDYGCGTSTNPLNIVGHWPLDGNPNDQIGSRNGTLNGVTSTSGKYNTAYDFSLGDQIDFPNTNFGFTEEITVSAWIRPQSNIDDRAPIVRIDQFYFQFYQNNRLATYWYGKSNQGYHYSSPNSVNINEWTHVAVTWGQNDVRFYINGNLDNVISGVTGTGLSTNWMKFGYEGGSRRFVGKIDDVKIFGRALAPNEISGIYATSSVELDVDINSSTPTTVSGTSTICKGQSTTLTAGGGVHGSGASYQWYEGGCASGSVIGTGSSITVSPDVTTTYYVRRTGTCNTTSCFARTVTVNQFSADPASTLAAPVGICSGQSTTLSVNELNDNGGALDFSTWSTGSGSASGFGQNGSTSENERINGTDPFGNSTVIWEARPDASSNADGGWNSSTFPIDNTKAYRYSVWVNRKVLGANGTFYLGLNGYGSTNGVIRLSNGTNQTNPYFYWSPTGLPEDQWVLVVGHVYPYNYTGTALHPESGRYTVDGTKYGNTTYDYKWRSETTSARHRTYLYYCTDVSVRQQWAYPRVDILDGTEPSVQDLINGFSVNNGLGAGANWQWYAGSCGGTAVGSGSSISVSPTTTTDYYVRAEGTCNTTACKNVTVVVNESPSTPTISSSGATTFCNGGSVDLTASSSLAGKSLSLNGSGDNVSIPNEPALEISGDMTIEMWIKPANFSARRNPFNRAYGGMGTITQEPAGNLNFYWGTAGANASPYQGFNSGGTLNLNQWNHIAIVRDITGNQLRWYINGSLTATTTPSYSAATVGNNPIIIGSGYTSGYAGEIDEVRLWKTARSTAEIQNNMNTTINPGSAGLAGYWRFDESPANNATVYDASGNSATGTFSVGSATRVTSTAPLTPTYTWSPGTGLNTTTGNTVTANPGSTQTYTVSALSPHGCAVSTNTQTVTVNPNPVPNPSANAPCEGQTLNLSASGGNSYTWSGPSGYSASVQNPNRTNASTAMNGTYSVTVSDANSCTTTDNVSVTVKTNPSVSVNNATICEGSTAILSATVNPSGGSYSWNTSATSSSINVSPGPPSQNYNVTYTATNGCQNTATGTVYVDVNNQGTSTWDGSVSTDWYNPENWSNCVPGAITEAIIPNGLSRYPEVNTSSPMYTGNAKCKKVNVGTGASLTIKTGATLDVNE